MYGLSGYSNTVTFIGANVLLFVSLFYNLYHSIHKKDKGLILKTLKDYREAIETVRGLGIYSEQDIRLGMSYIATLNLTSEQAEKLANIIGQLAIVTGSYADASQSVVNFIERGYVAGLKQLGIYTNLNAVKEYALAILGQEWNKLSEVEKQYVRYRYFIFQFLLGFFFCFQFLNKITF